MDWLAGVLGALFALVRLTAARYTTHTPQQYGTDLTSWYRACERDSSSHYATAAELRRMIEAYRRNRRSPRVSSLPETKPVVLELNERRLATASVR